MLQVSLELPDRVYTVSASVPASGFDGRGETLGMEF